METEISAEFDEYSPNREDIQELLDEIEEVFPEAEIEISDEEGAFPVPPADPFTLYLTASSSITLLTCIYPKLKEKISQWGGDAEVVNIEEVAKELLDTHTRASKDELDMMERDVIGDHVSYTFRYLPDGSEHYIEINRADVTEWVYEER